MGEDQKIFEIERHINLLDDRLKVIAEDIEYMISNHRLPMKRFETLRTIERQALLFKKGYSKTLNSRHLANEFGKSEAVDYVVFIDGKWSWDQKYFHFYKFLGALVLSKYPTKIEWGGNWNKFVDLPHFQLK